MAKEVTNENAGSGRTSTVTVSHNWLYGLLGLLILIIVFMAGVGIANHRWHNNAGPGKRFAMAAGARRAGRFGAGGANQADRTRGVVTAVDGNNFTIAGNGGTTKVVTSSSTTYQNGNQVKQNDSVVVFGTTSNGTLTATRVVINP